MCVCLHMDKVMSESDFPPPCSHLAEEPLTLPSPLLLRNIHTSTRTHTNTQAHTNTHAHTHTVCLYVLLEPLSICLFVVLRRSLHKRARIKSVFLCTHYNNYNAN